MNINRISLRNESTERAGQWQAATQIPNAEQSQSNAADDTVSAPSAAGDAERISAMGEASRSDRFNQVRNAIADGTYHISGEAIARKLIETARRENSGIPDSDSIPS